LCNNQRNAHFLHCFELITVFTFSPCFFNNGHSVCPTNALNIHDAVSIKLHKIHEA
jgi:hypothetical protein